MALLIGWKGVLEDRLQRDERHRCLRTHGRRRPSGCFLQYHAHHPRDKRLVQTCLCPIRHKHVLRRYPDRRNGKLLFPPHAFWLKPISAFGLLVLTTFINGSPAFSIPSTLVSPHVDARRHTISSRFWCSSCDDGSIVPSTSHHRVTTIAWPGRVPVAEHWVVSSHIEAQPTHQRLRVATR